MGDRVPLRKNGNFSTNATANIKSSSTLACVAMTKTQFTDTPIHIPTYTFTCVRVLVAISGMCIRGIY